MRRGSHPSFLTWRLSLLLAVFLCAACDQKQKAESASPTRARPLATVRMTTIEARPIDRVLAVTAELVARREAVVAPRLTGLPILAILGEVGDAVKAGDLLVKLARDDQERAKEEAELNLFEAKSKLVEAQFATKELIAQREGQRRVLEQAEADLKRTETQAERGVLSAEQLDQKRFERDRELSGVLRLDVQIERSQAAERLAEHAIARAVASAERAAEDLERTEVRAPISGIVSAREALIGSLSATGAASHRLFDPQSLIAEMRVPQQNLRDIQTGQALRLRSEVVPGLEFQAELVRIAPTVDRDSGIVVLEARIDLEATRKAAKNAAQFEGERGARLATRLLSGDFLKPGLFFSGEIVLEQKESAHSLPRKAIGTLRGQSFAFLITPIEARDAETPEGATHRVRRQFCEEGLSGDGVVEVLALPGDPPLVPGQSVVLVGQDRLRDGDFVRLADAVGEREDTSRDEVDQEPAGEDR